MQFITDKIKRGFRIFSTFDPLDSLWGSEAINKLKKDEIFRLPFFDKSHNFDRISSNWPILVKTNQICLLFLIKILKIKREKRICCF